MLATILKFCSRVRTPSFLISSEIPAQMTVLQQAQLYVDQLRREASKQRISVSEAISDMKVNTKMNIFLKYCQKYLGICNPDADRRLFVDWIQFPQT